jgi:hypothetical protein
MNRETYPQHIDDCRCQYDAIYEDALDRWTNEGGRPGVACCNGGGPWMAYRNWFVQRDHYARRLHEPA